MCTHRGAIYVRMPGGKRPIESRRELDQLLARGQSAPDDAKRRLETLAVAATALDAPDLLGERASTEPLEREWVLNVTPLGLDDDLPNRLRTHGTREACEAVAVQLLPPPTTADEYVEARAVPPGWATWAVRAFDAAAAAVIVDPSGVITAIKRERGIRSVINLDPLTDETIVPLLSGCLQVLAATGTLGRCLCTLQGRGFQGVTLQAMPDGNVPMPPGTRSSGVQLVSGTAGPEELQARARHLAKAIAADAGLMTFD